MSSAKMPQQDIVSGELATALVARVVFALRGVQMGLGRDEPGGLGEQQRDRNWDIGGFGHLCGRLLPIKVSGRRFICVTWIYRTIVIDTSDPFGMSLSGYYRLLSLEDESFLLQNGEHFMHNGRARNCHGVRSSGRGVSTKCQYYREGSGFRVFSGGVVERR